MLVVYVLTALIGIDYFTRQLGIFDYQYKQMDLEEQFKYNKKLRRQGICLVTLITTIILAPSTTLFEKWLVHLSR